MPVAGAVATSSDRSGKPGMSHVQEFDLSNEEAVTQGCPVFSVSLPLRVTNVVSKAHLNCKLDLNDVEQKLPMAQYIPRQFSGLLLRILQPVKAHCQIYSNGKITINGGESLRQNRALAKRFTDQLISVGYNCDLSDYTVVNIVCSVDLHRKLPL